MELNGNKKADPKDSHYSVVRRATETRNAVLKATVELVQTTAQQNADVLARLSTRTDSIELSAGAASLDEPQEAPQAEDRSGRIAELKAAVEDGSLFDQARLERAAERLLTFE
ncbi:hypothetical protein Poly30_05400 [Planctomycetes bacterium Poly30]|uniref:Anti-sigma-28 factor FlgM C-terminal domain-containing protein n=1 Tax=Saltatorellus ferox TaxID=2528018 RepID=A0A518ELS9_9BACT|nr:hypothetical protein Poly30_05400 [Planctomycetes bacterium Poly30]